MAFKGLKSFSGPMRQTFSLGRTPRTMSAHNLANTIPVVRHGDASCYGGTSQQQGLGHWSELREG